MGELERDFNEFTRKFRWKETFHLKENTDDIQENINPNSSQTNNGELKNIRKPHEY